MCLNTCAYMNTEMGIGQYSHPPLKCEYWPSCSAAFFLCVCVHSSDSAKTELPLSSLNECGVNMSALHLCFPGKSMHLVAE